MSSNIWETAKEMELQGKTFYEEQAAFTPLKELRGTFARLAVEEQKHYELFDKLSKEQSVEPLSDPDTLGNAKEVFKSLRSSFDVAAVQEDAVTAYGKALKMEEGAIAYYSDAMSKVSTDNQKAALAAIIEEEKKHVRLMEAISEFVRRPKEWLENAEFTQIDAY